MSAQHDVNLLLLDWDNLLTQYARATVDAAQAEAEHKRLRARVVVTEKHRDPKAPLSLCEAIAEADTEVAAALSRRLITAATVEAMRGKLAWFRSNADAKRSEIASERQNAALYSQGTGT